MEDTNINNNKKKSKKSIDGLENKIVRDELSELIVNEINKANKDGGKVAFFLDEQEDPSMVSDWVSTGSSLLDLAISNRPNGGLPAGRLIEFSGLEGTGKSLLSAHVIANTQKMGGLGVVLDTENAAAPEFWKSLGVDLKNLPYIQCDTVEDIFEKIEHMVAVVRKANKNKLLTIIVDSVAAASTKVEMESDHGKDGYATGKAIIISKALRKITNMIGKQRVLIVFTNQLRQNLAFMPGKGEKWTISGGKGMAYHSSVRVRLSNLGKLKKGEDVIGNKCKALVIKNRMGPPQRSAEFGIYFDSGIADYASWIEVLKEQGIVSGETRKYKYTDSSGIVHEFSGSEFVNLMNNNPKLKEELYMKIADSVIMKYKDPNSVVIDEATVDSDDDETVSTED